MIRLVLTVALVLIAGMSQAQTRCTAPANHSSLVTALGDGVNAARQGQGLPPLRADTRLMQAAQGHACDLAPHGEMTHRGSDGSNSADRASRAGFRTCLTAENLAWGFPRAEQIVSGWMGSAGHRRNILLDRVSHYGAGVADGPRGTIWVMVYARAC